jgi:hypothetical protein
MFYDLKMGGRFRKFWLAFRGIASALCWSGDNQGRSCGLTVSKRWQT